MIIDPENVRFKASRSSGPGGSRVNRRSTRVEIWIKVGNLPLSPKDKNLIRRKLAHHLNHKDEIWVENQETRSQEMNRDLATERLNAMLKDALQVPKVRIPTEPRRGAVEGRIKAKKIISEKKRARRASHKNK